jgi:hypothetical protein
LDPNLFHLDWDRVWEVVSAVAVLSVLLERALSVLFEHRGFIARFDKAGLKEPIAYGASLFVCWYWDFDAVSSIILRDSTTIPGYLITAGIVAGGSKGSQKLFTDLLKVRSSAAKAKAEAEADPLPDVVLVKPVIVNTAPTP